MILSASKILEKIESGDIVISPFKRENLNPNSYDLTLSPNMKVYSVSILDSRKKNETADIFIPNNGYTLAPGELYIASTIEYTETKFYVPIINGKSSNGRLGLDVHKTAGFGDIGFCGNWTLEITATLPVIVYPGMKIAQIHYHLVDGAIDVVYAGKYQGQTSAVESRSYIDFEEGK